MENKRSRMDSEESGIERNRDKNRGGSEVNPSYGDRSQTPSREHQGGRREGNLGEQSDVDTDRSDIDRGVDSDFDNDSSLR